MNCLYISCVFSCANNTVSFRYFLPHGDGFSSVKNVLKLIKSAYFSIYDDYGLNSTNEHNLNQ